MADRDVFHDMHEAAAAFTDLVKSGPYEKRHMRAAFLGGAAWHDGLSAEEVALLRLQAYGRKMPSPEALATTEALTRTGPVLLPRECRCPYPMCDDTHVHTLRDHPGGTEWAAEHDLWDEQTFVAPTVSQRGY